jgi:hypothetical protein
MKHEKLGPGVLEVLADLHEEGVGGLARHARTMGAQNTWPESRVVSRQAIFVRRKLETWIWRRGILPNW